MEILRNNLSWYKAKIGNHDKQLWEQSVEARVFQSISDLPKRDANQDSRELLDVDLIKGSAFTKAKPSHTVNIRTWKGLVRLLFMPLFWRWWVQHTSKKFLAGALLLYTAQVCISIIYYISDHTVMKNNSLFEVTNPLMLMFVLSVIHTQIVFTQSTQHQSRYKKKRIAIKRANTKSKTRIPLHRRKAKSSKAEELPSAAPRTKIKDLPKRLSSDSSDVEERLLLDENRLSSNVLLSTGESTQSDSPVKEPSTPTREISRPERFVEGVPDVAVHAVEQDIMNGGGTTAGSNSPELRRLRKRVDTNANNLLSPNQIRASNGSSDLDSPTLASDTEWEHNNRVYSSDVACSDTSSEYETDDAEDEQQYNQDSDGPIRLERENSLTMGYIPSAYDKMSCIIWENNQCKKVDLSVIDLGSIIESRVAAFEYEPSDSFYIGIVFTCLIAFFPFLFRTYHSPKILDILSDVAYNRTEVDLAALREASKLLLGSTWQEVLITMNGLVQRFFQCSLFCFLVIVAESSYWQRLQYAKYFSYLTSSRRSRKYDVPHFRLNKVKNIKIWLSLRAYLKKRGPQRSVEVIVAANFILMVVLLATMCVQLLQDVDSYLLIYGNWELTLCCLALTVYLLRFYSLGTKITKKYRNLSTLITEQINLYLHMEQKPHKKEELLLANAVLKLAEGLIKELESPYKLFNTMVNPVVFNATRLVMLSAFSAVVSELLGFKLKLHKVKI